MNMIQKYGNNWSVNRSHSRLVALIFGVTIFAQGSVLAALDSNTDRLVFAQTDPTAPSEQQRVVTLKNTGDVALTVTSHDFIDGGGLGFVASDNCDGVVLEKDGECMASFQWQPTSKGQRSALYQWSSDQDDQITVLLTNRFVQSTEQESQRRLPPVIERIDLFQLDANGNESPVADTALNPTGEYRMRWYSASYDDLTQTTVVLFDCGPEGGVNSNCGDSFRNFIEYAPLATGTLLTNSDAEALGLATYNYNGNSASHLGYSYDFNLNELASISEVHKLVLRYYQKGGQDALRGNSSISMMVPGGLSLLGQGKDTYFEPGGRRLQMPVQPGEAP